jgi:hypothetical protein
VSSEQYASGEAIQVECEAYSTQSGTSLITFTVIWKQYFRVFHYQANLSGNFQYDFTFSVKKA